MKEGKIILPLFDNDGRDLNQLHARMRASLTRMFGGATENRGIGSWRDPATDEVMTEPVTTFVVAGGEIDNKDLREIAHFYAKEAKQKAVYYVDFGGHVRLDVL